ncbi:hypothetical protein R5R35_004860 [Gryllus longicercus]|uniref:Glycosyltransferase family 92 protein n=2 Tax=Gryllus longicercus TaxID=2509291 RepID=A0AAN9Z2B6_9ORTH
MRKEALISLHTNEWRTPKPTMRKYYQLTLVVVSVISVVSLLIYRHEYNRLRYVLEVLNFFGTPGQSASASECAPFNVTRLNYDILGFREHLPTWQRISSTYSVYSAFWEASDGSNRVKAVGIGLMKSEPNFKCHVWFEDETDPVPGKFSYLLLEDKDNTVGNFKLPKGDGLNAHFLYCKPQASLGIPTGVSFYVSTTHVPFKPFIPVQSIDDRTIVENSTLVCVAPNSLPVVSKTSVVEFLSYHQLVGINDFIVYDRTLPSQFPVVLQNRVVQERFNLRVLFLPWNFPYSAVDNDRAVRLAVEKDCVMRAWGKVRNVVVLSWNDYIVPKLFRSLAVMLDNLESDRKITLRFSLPTLVFCTDLADDPQADSTLPMAARKTKCLKGSGLDKMFHVYRPLSIPGNRTGSTRIVSPRIAAVHRYISCFKEKGTLPSEENLMYEPTVLKFASDLKRSKLLKAGETSKLFQ